MNNGTTRKKVNKIIFHQFNVVHSKNNKTNCIEKVTSAHSPLFENKNNFIIFRYMKPFHGVAYAEAFFFFWQALHKLSSEFDTTKSLAGRHNREKNHLRKTNKFFLPVFKLRYRARSQPVCRLKRGTFRRNLSSN